MVAGYLSLLYSISQKPLEYWAKRQSQTGCIRKILDSDLFENVIEIQDVQQSNIPRTCIICPPNATQALNVKLPVLVIVVKNLNLECRIQLQVVDTNKVRHHFQFYSTDFERARHVRDPVICRARIHLEPGWNKLEFDLRALTESAFKSRYAATQRLEICANCRLRRIYFVDRHYEDSEISAELCKGFLDLYMLKWGIHKVDRTTQTKHLKKKIGTKTGGNDTSTNEMVYESEAEDPIMSTCTRFKGVNPKFMKNIRYKSNSLIEDFFSKQQSTLPNVEDFKRQISIKPYVLPALIITSQKNDEYGDPSYPLHSINHISKELNLARSPLNIEKPKVDEKEEKWTYRYLYEGKHYSKTDDVKEEQSKKQQEIRSKKPFQWSKFISGTFSYE